MDSDSLLMQISANYDGLQAKDHRMEMFSFGTSLQGLAKIFTSSADFCQTLHYSKKRLSKNNKIYICPSTTGSYHFLAELYHIAVQNDLFSGLGSNIISGFIGWFIAKATKKNEEKKLKEEILIKFEQRIINLENNGRVNNLEKRIKWLEEEINTFFYKNSSSAKKIVEPIGKTCNKITLNCKKNNENIKIVLDRHDKEIILLPFDEIIEEDEALKIFITGTDIENGTCKVRIDGLDKRINAVIVDQDTFEKNSDPYSEAMANRSNIVVKATKVFRGQELKKILIKGPSNN